MLPVMWGYCLGEMLQFAGWLCDIVHRVITFYLLTTLGVCRSWPGNHKIKQQQLPELMRRERQMRLRLHFTAAV